MRFDRELDAQPSLHRIVLKDKYLGDVKSLRGKLYYVSHRWQYMRIVQGFGLSEKVIRVVQMLVNSFDVVIIYHGKEGVRVYKSHWSDWLSKPKLIRTDDTHAENDKQFFLGEEQMDLVGEYPAEVIQ